MNKNPEFHITFAHPDMWDHSWRNFLPYGIHRTGMALCETTDNPEYAVGTSVLRLDIQNVVSGEMKTAWYDLGDFTRDKFEETVGESKAHYFKIQALDEKCKLPNFHPIPQTHSITLFSELKDYRALRDLAYYEYDVMHIGRNTDRDGLRIKATQMIKSRKDLESDAFITQCRNRCAIPEGVEGKKYTAEHYWAMAAQTKIVVALPGVGGDWTWRHMECLAMGIPCLTIESPFAMPGNGLDFPIFITVKRDLSNMLEVIDYYLTHSEEREIIGAAGKEYYDKYCAPIAQADYIIRTVFNAKRQINKRLYCCP